MPSSVTISSTPQQSAKKGKNKNKDMMVLVEDRLTEFNTTMSSLIGRVGNMDKQRGARAREGDGRASR